MKQLCNALAVVFVVAFTLTPQAARAQQSAKRAIAVTQDAPGSVVLGGLPQITEQQMAAQLHAPAHARLRGIPAQEYALLKAAAASTKLPAPKGAAQPLVVATPLPPPADGPAATKITAFGGIGERCGDFIPPDMALAAGPSFVVQVINGCLSVFDKAGHVQAGFPKSLTSFMLVSPSALLPPFDPRALFDWANQRYIVSAAHISATAVPFVDVAVSQSSNPLGGWFIYHFNLIAGPILTGGKIADFPTLGQDRRAIYLAFNAFTLPETFNGAFMLLLPKGAMYAGAGFTFHFLPPSSFTITGTGEVMDSLQPANVMDRSDNPRAEFVVASHNIDAPGGLANAECATGCSGVAVFAISNPIFSSGSPGPEVSQVLVSTVDTYSLPPLAEQSGCTAPGLNCTLLDTGDTRVSGEIVYASGSLYAALGTNGTGNGSGASHFLWFQIRPVLNDNNDLACSGAFRNKCPQIVGASILNEVCWACASGQGDGTGATYYPEVQPDPEGNVLVVFNYSDATTFPSSAYATNRATQALGTMHDSGFFLQKGLATYVSLDNNKINRWGDYTAASVDLTPGTRASFWFAAESSNAAGLYRTAIGHNAFSGPAQP